MNRLRAAVILVCAASESAAQFYSSLLHSEEPGDAMCSR